LKQTKETGRQPENERAGGQSKAEFYLHAKLFVGLLVGVLAMFLSGVTVFLRRLSMLLCLVMLVLFMMMNSFAVMMSCRFMVPRCVVMMLAGLVLHGHGMNPS
jgi:uncharacterized membrane-anchored protein